MVLIAWTSPTLKRAVHTWTYYRASRRSYFRWTRWCPCCQSSPGSACHMVALLQTGADGAGWSGEQEVEALKSCGSARGCRPCWWSRREMSTMKSLGGAVSHGAPPTGIEPRQLLSVWARPDDGAALQSPADLEGEGDVWSMDMF